MSLDVKIPPLLLLASLSCLLLALGWVLRFFTPIRFYPAVEIKGQDLARGFFLFLFTQSVFLPLIASILLPFFPPDFREKLEGAPLFRQWAHFFIVAAGGGAASLSYSSLSAAQKKALFGQAGVPWKKALAAGVIGWMISYPTASTLNAAFSLVTSFFFQEPTIEQGAVQLVRKTVAEPFLFAAATVAVAIVVPMTEEYLFRGLLQSWLRAKWRSCWPAILLSSFVFACFHFSFSYGWTNLPLLASLFFLSCMLGYLFEKERSLIAPIALHSCFNFTSLLMLYRESIG